MPNPPCARTHARVCAWLRVCAAARLRVCVAACAHGCVCACAWLRGCVAACVRGCVCAWLRVCVCVAAWLRVCVAACVRGFLCACVRMFAVARVRAHDPCGEWAHPPATSSLSPSRCHGAFPPGYSQAAAVTMWPSRGTQGVRRTALCKGEAVTAAKLAGEDAREARRERRVGWKAPALKGTVRTAHVE